MINADEVDRQHEALVRLDRAVANFDVADALQALHDSDVLAGLRQRLQSRWPSLRNDADYYHVIAQGVDALADHLERRKRVTEPIGLVWRVAERKASDEVWRRQRETPMDPHVMGGKVLPVLPLSIEPAIQEARRLLPRVNGENARSVLSLVLDAMEQGRPIVTAVEIAETLGITEDNARQLRRRAFERLTTLARTEQAAGRSFALPDLEDDDELLVQPDCDDNYED